MASVTNDLLNAGVANISWSIGFSYTVMYPTTEAIITIGDNVFLNRDVDRTINIVDYPDFAEHCVAAGLTTRSALDSARAGSGVLNLLFAQLYRYQVSNLNLLLDSRLESNEIVMTRIQ